MNIDLTRRDAEFPATDPSLLRRAVGDREALASFLAAYRPKLRQIVRHQYRINSNEADDLLQDFYLKKVLTGSLLEGYRPDKVTKFRSYMKQVLRNHVIDHFRRSGREPSVELDPDRLVDTAGPEPDLVVDYGWARTVVGRGLRRMKRSCEQDTRRSVWWPLVKLRLVRPALGRGRRVEYAEVVRRCGFRSPTQAHEIYGRAIKFYSQCIRDSVREYAADTEVEAELAELQDLFERGQSFADLWRALASGRRTGPNHPGTKRP